MQQFLVVHPITEPCKLNVYTSMSPFKRSVNHMLYSISLDIYLPTQQFA